MSAFAQGLQSGLQRAGEDRARKYQLTDEERQLKAKDLIDTRNGILTNLPKLLGPNGEKTPEYDAAFQSLTQAQQDLGQLYHPDKAPGALQKDWHFLLEKMHNIVTPKSKQASAVALQPPATAQSTSPAAPQAAPAPPTYQPTMGSGASTPAALPPVAPETGGMQTPNTPGFGPTTPGAQPSTPLFISQSFEGKPAPGMTSQGNIDLFKRPNIDNGDGTHSSTFSMSFGTDKGEVLVPGVGDGKTYPERQLRVLYTLPDGTQKWAVPGNQPHNWIAPERPTPQNNEALNQYQKTGKNFGTFEDEKDADAYGKKLHEDQEKYGNNGVTAHPVSKSGNISATPPAPAKAPSWGQAQVLKQKAAAMQKAQQEAGLLASATPLSPQQQAMSQFHADEAVKEAQIDASLKLAEKLGITGPALEEFKQQLVGIKNTSPKNIPGAAGAPYKGEDGLWYRPVLNPDNTTGRIAMPPDWKPNTKAVRGTLVNSKEHGWIQTWVDPLNPSRIVGWQKAAPGSRYTGTTGSSSSTDPFGVTTSTSRSSAPTSGSTPVDINLSGVEELPETFTGEESSGAPVAQGKTPSNTAPPSGSPNKNLRPSSAPPASVSTPKVGVTTSHPTSATPKELRDKVPAPPQAPSSGSPQYQVDSEGHIPDADIKKYGLNSNAVAIANNVLDGADITKVSLKDRGAVENLAKQYGWQGQGLFTPKEKLLLKESATYLDKAMKDPSMKVLDSKESRVKIANAIHAASDNAGMLSKTMAVSFGLTPQESNFVTAYLQLIGTISGLGQLTRGGRMTEATAKRLMNELPNPLLTQNSADGIDKLNRLRSEINVATQKGSFDLSDPDANKAGGLSADEFRKKHFPGK